MTCFWDGILRKISISDFEKFGLKQKPYRATELALFLKENNRVTYNVLWNGRKILRRQMRENYVAVKVYKVTTAWNGYLCSTFDPFLFLLCELFEVSIEHWYLGSKITYTYVPPTPKKKKDSKKKGNGKKPEKNENKKDEKKDVKKEEETKIDEETKEQRIWKFGSNRGHFYCHRY